jgi:hypothetical protein
MLDIRLNGTKKEIEDFLYIQSELRNYYEFTEPSDFYENRNGDGFRVYFNATKKRVIKEYKTRVAGISHDNRQEHIKWMDNNTPLFLEREKDNPYDKNAVKVLAEIRGKRTHIGYIHREFAENVAPILDSNQKVIIQNVAVDTERYGDETDSWREWEFLGVRIILIFEEDTF